MTTYPVSTAPAAKAWLFGQMQDTLTATADATFSCSYASEIDTLNSPDDQVWMGSIANRVVSHLAFVGDLGQWALQEEYDLEVKVSCYRAGDDSNTAEARAWAIAGQIETIARTDPTFGGLLITAQPSLSSSDVDWDAEENANGRVADLTLTIHCLAAI
jgi:hypothetical protein